MHNELNKEKAKANPKQIYQLIGLFEIIKVNEDNTETSNFAIGNFLNISKIPVISARDYITFIARFLRNEFKFTKYRIISLSLNNGAYTELYASTQSKKFLEPITAFFKAFNSAHYYMKLNYDVRIVDMFRDIYPTVIYDNKYAIKELDELKKSIKTEIKLEADTETSSEPLVSEEPEIKPE